MYKSKNLRYQWKGYQNIIIKIWVAQKKKNQYLKTTGIKLSGWMPSVPWWYIIKRFKTNLSKWQNDNRQGNQ